MEISAFTRTVVKKNHALICPDGYINSNLPGWKNCTTNILISGAMGAGLSQILVTANDDCTQEGSTENNELFCYLLTGKTTCSVKEKYQLKHGHFIFIAPGEKYFFDKITPGTQILFFQKNYEPLTGAGHPETIVGDASKIPGPAYLGDDALRLQVLLPDTPNYDMAVNIFTYEGGGHLPMVETHIMEHGLLYLQGQGIYRLDDDWYPVKKGDAIWMAPFCRQWFTAMGKEPAVYIYYKNVNRFPF